MKKLIYLLLSIELLSCSNSSTLPYSDQSQQQLSNDAIALMLPYTQRDLLCEAYRSDSLQLLEMFFTRWQNELPPLSNIYRAKLSDIQRTVYEVFEYFNNYDLKKYSNSYEALPYCMIQNEIVYSIMDTIHLEYAISDSIHANRGTIEDFRPLPSNLSAKALYVTPSYRTLLQNFIKQNACAFAKNNKVYNKPWPGWPRANFLEQRVQLRASMLGFHINTLPFVSIQFNRTMTEAVVEWNKGNVWASDLFYHSNGIWKHIRSLNWSIE